MPAELGPSLQDDNGDDDSGYEPTSVGDPDLESCLNRNGFGSGKVEEIVEDKPSEEAKGRDSCGAPPKVGLLVMILLKIRNQIATIFFICLKIRNAPFAKKQNKMHFLLGE